MPGKSNTQIAKGFVNTFIDWYCYYEYLYSYREALVKVEDLMELDFFFTKVMLYMCPHKDLSAVLSLCDPVLANSFYIWYLDYHGKEFVIKAKDSEVNLYCNNNIYY